MSNLADPQPTILVIDDSADQLTVLGELLQPHYHVRVASNGQRGLQLAAEAPLPDLILLDVMMPRMDGYHVLKALRGQPLTRDIPVMFVTALDTAGEEQHGLLMGAADYIVKPFNPQIVLARVHTQLELKQARDALRRQNASLEAEVQQRRLAEDEVRHLNQELHLRSLALERSMADLESFTYSVSHDLHAPLRAIHGFAEILAESERDTLGPAGSKWLQLIRTNADRMGRLIDDLLRLFRIGRRGLALADIDLADLAHKAAAELQPAYPEAQVTIAALPQARVDSGLMLQVFANLIGNALKYSSRAPHPQVTVGTEAVAGETAIFVRDNGVGFDMAYAKGLFTPFQRMHGEKEFPGSGIGLAIVKRILDCHNGRIWASTRPGEGATFYFTLDTQAAPAAHPPTGTPPQG